MKHMTNLIIFFSAAVLILSSCGEESSQESSSEGRSFYMGFSPWPYDATLDAVNWTNTRINTEGDIISQHMEQGIPWPEAHAGETFPQAFQTDIQSRLENQDGENKTVLQISPLNMGRNGMALYRGENESEPLPSPWDEYTLDSDEVKQAYLNYALKMIEYFDPEYLILGVEVNLLITNAPDLWDDYISLHSYVYTEVKKSHPDLPMGVSLFCCCFFPQWSPEHTLEDQLAGVKDLDEYADFFAFSVHPFMSALLADTFPEDYMENLFAVTDKPVAVSESSYPAQKWQTSDNPPLVFKGDNEKQEAFTARLLEESDRADALFVIWFSIRDYDALWEGLLQRDETALIWRDTGLYDEEGNLRSAGTVWTQWLNMNVTE